MLRVNGETVDPDLVDEAFLRLKAEAEMLSELSCCERDDEFRTQAEEEVIDGILLAQEAERRIPEPPAAEIRTAFEATLREWREHGASWDLLDARREFLRGETISRLRMEKFTADLWAELADPSEAELRAWYDDHAARFRQPPAALVRHLVRFPQAADPWDDYAAMLELRRRALDGEDFASLAAAHTQKPDGGIELGWIEQQRILNPFEAMLFSLRQGEIGPVFFYEQALHLVQAVEVRPAATRPFAEVSDELRAELVQARRRAAFKELAARLRRDARIEHEPPRLSDRR
jgi:hypothetical protein